MQCRCRISRYFLWRLPTSCSPCSDSRWSSPSSCIRCRSQRCPSTKRRQCSRQRRRRRTGAKPSNTLSTARGRDARSAQRKTTTARSRRDSRATSRSMRPTCTSRLRTAGWFLSPEANARLRSSFSRSSCSLLTCSVSRASQLEATAEPSCSSRISRKSCAAVIAACAATAVAEAGSRTSETGYVLDSVNNWLPAAVPACCRWTRQVLLESVGS
mmetsp:Transcript_114438/g.364845  ORF Transcript_114438/g.364845 Transcript_114438/m.364845 type:complete len:214 (-) Transcript_114438:197-838(-)